MGPLIPRNYLNVIHIPMKGLDCIPQSTSNMEIYRRKNGVVIAVFLYNVVLTVSYLIISLK